MPHRKPHNRISLIWTLRNCGWDKEEKSRNTALPPGLRTRWTSFSVSGGNHIKTPVVIPDARHIALAESKIGAAMAASCPPVPLFAAGFH